jgi:hypothetical protein
MDGWVDCWINGQRPRASSIHPIIQKSKNPVSCLWLWLTVADETKNPRLIFSRGFLLKFISIQQAPTASLTTTTTASLIACEKFFNIAL